MGGGEVGQEGGQGGRGAGIGLQGAGVGSWGQEGAWAALGLRQVRRVCCAHSVYTVNALKYGPSTPTPKSVLCL